MHLDLDVIEGFVARRIQLTQDECLHLEDCDSCRNAVLLASKHIDPKRLFDLAQMDVIFGESEWPHLSVCDSCASRFTAFLKARIHEERKRLANSGR